MWCFSTLDKKKVMRNLLGLHCGQRGNWTKLKFAREFLMASFNDYKVEYGIQSGTRRQSSDIAPIFKWQCHHLSSNGCKELV